MESQVASQQLTFEGMTDRPVVVQPSAGMMSRDAGLIPVRELDWRWKWTDRFSGCLEDPRVDPEHASNTR